MSLNTYSFIETNVLNQSNLNELNGSDVGDILIKMNNNNNNNNLFFQSGTNSNTDTGFCISSSNNIGFGTTNVKEKIDISGSIITDNYKLQSKTTPIIDINSNIKTTGYINISKGLSINDNKFIVDSSGNTKMLGNLDISNNLNLNNVFGISSNGNFTTKGKLDISGYLNINNNFTVLNTGDVLIKGLLDVTNKTTFNSDVSLNGGVLDIGNNHTLYIDSSNNRVGIGSIPDASYNFYVKGNTKIKGDLVINGTTSIQDTSNNTVTSFNLTNNGTGPAIIVNQLGDQPIAKFTDDNNPVLFIANNGLTGVGKVDPSYNLDIMGTALVKQNLNVNNGLSLIKPVATELDIIQVSGGYATSMFLRKSDGAVFGCGYNYGSLGVGWRPEQYFIKLYQTLGVNGVGYITNIIQIHDSGNHGLFLRNDGAVFASGNNANGQLGINSTDNQATLQQVRGVGGNGYISDIVQVTAGESSFFLRGTDGAVFGCGNNGSGELGINLTGRKQTLQQVLGVGGVGYITGITQISAYGSHVLFLRGSDGAVFACGNTYFGQLGLNILGQNGNPSRILTVQQVLGVDGIGYITGITQISTNAAHSLFLRGSDGAVFSCGHIAGLGIGTTDPPYYKTLQQVKGVNGVGYITGITKVYAGSYMSFLIRGDGAVYICSGAPNGYLGNNSITALSTPTLMNDPSGSGYLTNVVQVSSGNNHVIILKSNGIVYIAGSNEYGQLGINSTSRIFYPALQQVLDASGNIPSPVVSNTNSVTLNNNTKINNNLDISQGIIVNDKVKIDASGNLDTSGNVTVAGTVTVYGNISQSGVFNQDGDIDVSGNAILKGNLDISQNLRVNADKFMIDPSSGNIIAKGTMDISGNFNVNNKFKIDSSGNITSTGTLDLSQNFSINQNNLIVDSSGNVKSKGQIDVSNNFVVNTNKFIVDNSGNVQIPGTLDISNNLTVNTNKFIVNSTTGTIQSAGNVDISKNFIINTNKFIVDSSGNVKSAGTLDISNNLAVNNNKFIIDTNGNIKSAGNFDISDNFSLNTNSILIDKSGNILAKGALTGVQNFSINNNNFDIDVSGNAKAKGNFDLSQNMSVGTNIFKTNIDNNYIGLNTYYTLSTTDISSNSIYKNVIDISGNIATSTGFFGDINNSIILSHRDYANDTDYLIKQSSIGEITINSKSLTETIDLCFDNVPQCKISNDGDMTINGTIYTYSDIRIKENVQVIENALEKVKALQGIKYNLINEDETNKKKHIGLLAQDVEKVMPEAIELDGDIKTVAYGNLIGLLIQSIKELYDKYKTIQQK
jgi:alpha-tubulin suppressor-like RCC1 family protein